MRRSSTGSPDFFLANKKISSETKNLTSAQIDSLPDYPTGLLLGTSKNLIGGGKNSYFEYRIQTAVDLYESGKISNLIVSGDNGTVYYNEPLQMKNALIKEGIPEDKIYLDYAGFRTLDSVIRAKEIFGQTNIIIISQKFHNQRAVFIAEHNGINAFGYNAQEVNSYAGLKTNFREYFARFKVFLDMITHTQPKFLGEKVIIKI
jgi:SanA protein